MFGQIRKQRDPFFGRPTRSTFLFNRYMNTGSNKSISVDPIVEQNPLLENAMIYLKASYSDQDAMEKMKNIGYNHDVDLSNNETNVYVKDGKALILHRSSSNAKDFLISDILLAFNYSALDPRVWSAKKSTRQTQLKYNTIADHVGHSLGGFIGEICADPKAYILTYNKGASPYYIDKAVSSRQLDIRTRGDLVSLMSKFQNSNSLSIENRGKGFLNAHNLNNLD